MKYIEIDSYGKKIQFTTRSVFIDGKEYPYSAMSSVRYSLEKKVYAFKCGDEVQYIRYEDKDEKALSAIFSQIRKMHQKRDAAAAAKAVAPAGVHAFSVADVMNGKEVSSPDVSSRFTTRISVQDLLDSQAKEAAATEAPVSAEAAAEAPVEEAASALEVGKEAVSVSEGVEAASEEAAEAVAETTEAVAEAAETAEETKTEAAEAAEEAKAETKDAAAEAKAAAAAAKAEAKAKAQEEKEKLRAEKEKARQEKAAAKAKEREEKAKAKKEKAAAAGEAGVQSRFKKAIIIFVVILLFFVALGCAWYATMGLSSAPVTNPGATESQSYDDIDEMIQDLEE